ncbi:MAG: zinc-ribbon domain-containing protein [Lachnospiraceae bacterium]|nr:zinc-ribbon domain-containing protein [Lachnospiraceae bacterium]
MKCSVCGSDIRPGDKFCMACGTAVETMIQAEAESNAAAQATAPAAPVIPEVVMPEAVTTEAQTKAPETEPASEPAPTGAYFADKAEEPDAPETPVNETTTAQGPVPVAVPVYAQQTPAYAQQNPAYAQGSVNQTYVQPAVSYAQSAEGGYEERNEATSILVLGIVSLSLACSVFLSIGGIICGAIGLSKSNAYYDKYKINRGKAVVGRHLSRAGLITGIAMAAYFSLIILAAIVSEI